MENLILLLNLVILAILGWHVFFKRSKNGTKNLPQILLDTSAIIDGRIAEVAQAGFLRGQLLVPQFVLSELHNIADSSDDMRRSRGRFGLEVIRRLQSMQGVNVTVVEDNAQDVEAVDDKLVAMAKQSSAALATTDFNLNKVASVNGVAVLNVNELAQLLRPLVLPGEKIAIKLVQRGSDRGQAVGYLEDGTMVVVDRADRLRGQEVEVEITKIMQTTAGRMLFARLLHPLRPKRSLN